MSLYPDTSTQLNNDKGLARIIDFLNKGRITPYELFTNAEIQREMLEDNSALSLDQQLSLLLSAVNGFFVGRWLDQLQEFDSFIWSVNATLKGGLLPKELPYFEQLKPFQLFVQGVMSFNDYNLCVRTDEYVDTRSMDQSFWDLQPTLEDIYGHFLIDETYSFRSVAVDVIRRVGESHAVRSVFIGGDSSGYDGFSMNQVFERRGIKHAHIGLFVPTNPLRAVRTGELLACNTNNWSFYLWLLRDRLSVVYADSTAPQASFSFFEYIEKMLLMRAG